MSITNRSSPPAALTSNEAAYCAAARRCAAANADSFAPEDLCLYGYPARDKRLAGTTGSLVAKQIIAAPEDGWSWFITPDSE